VPSRKKRWRTGTVSVSTVTLGQDVDVIMSVTVAGENVRSYSHEHVYTCDNRSDILLRENGGECRAALHIIHALHF
jgi:hypothetical protein